MNYDEEFCFHRPKPLRN